MTRTQKLLRLLATALIAALVAGGVANTILGATPLKASWPLPYLWGFGAALLGAAMCSGAPGLIAALSVLAVYLGVTLLGGAFGARALFEAARAFGESGDVSLLAAHAPAAAMLLGVGLGLLFFLLVRKRGGVFFAAVIALVAILAACAIGEDAGVGAAVPALIGLAAAYAFASDAERDWKSCLRALVPAALAVLLALLLVPQGRLTWAPLENAADSLRNAFEDYFRFSEVRQTFSLQERGYNYTVAGENGEPEPRLGGPADPDTTPVMRVRADGDLLLRGTIRRDYTGYSWVDTGEKARYLYYDFTRRGARAEIFGSDAVPGGENRLRFPHRGGGDAGRRHEHALCRPSADGLFHGPAKRRVLQLHRRSVPLPATWKRATGTPSPPWRRATRRRCSALTLERASAQDEGCAGGWRKTCLALPDGGGTGRVRSGGADHRRRAGRLCQGRRPSATGWRTTAATRWRWTTRPPSATSFPISCSIPARATAATSPAPWPCSAAPAGLPARYVEGYSLHAAPGESVVLTGEDAHAWVEVYFNGVGWLTFDPTAAAQDAQGASSPQGGTARPRGREPGRRDEPPARRRRIATRPRRRSTPRPRPRRPTTFRPPPPPPRRTTAASRPRPRRQTPSRRRTAPRPRPRPPRKTEQQPQDDGADDGDERSAGRVAVDRAGHRCCCWR